MRCTPLHLSLPFLLSADKLPLHTYTPTVQEWVIHAWLLHSPFDWMGRRIHVGHHQRPYFHVSSDAVTWAWTVLVWSLCGHRQRPMLSCRCRPLLLVLLLESALQTAAPLPAWSRQHRDRCMLAELDWNQLHSPSRCPLTTRPLCWPSWLSR